MIYSTLWVSGSLDDIFSSSIIMILGVTFLILFLSFSFICLHLICVCPSFSIFLRIISNLFTFALCRNNMIVTNLSSAIVLEPFLRLRILSSSTSEMLLLIVLNSWVVGFSLDYFSISVNGEELVVGVNCVNIF